MWTFLPWLSLQTVKASSDMEHAKSGPRSRRRVFHDAKSPTNATSVPHSLMTPASLFHHRHSHYRTLEPRLASMLQVSSVAAHYGGSS